MVKFLRVTAAQLAIGLMGVFLALFVGLFAYFIAAGIRQTEERFGEKALSASQVVAINAYWISELANQTLRRVDAVLGPELLGDAESITPAMQGLPSATEIYVINARAETVFATIEGASSVSVADREYFTALRDGAGFYTSPLLVSRINGERIFVFSKRLDRDGEFAGAVMVSFPETLMEDMWNVLDLDPGSTVSLVRADGQLMARHPPPDGPVDLSNIPLFTELLPQSSTGTYLSERSPIDGVARLVSYRRVPDTNIVALASIATQDTWDAFNMAIATVILIVSPIALGLVLGCWWIVRLLNRDARRAHELQASVELNTLLFREIHHRVKNNMQSVQALVRMQNIPEAAKRDLQSRFAAMAAMHEHIYKHDRYDDIEAADFIPAVVEQIKTAYGSDAELLYELEPAAVDRDHATPLALLLSELVTNAFKYASGQAERDSIYIGLERLDNGKARLIVRDQGPGFADVDQSKSMGMRLIKGVVAQMDGTYEFRNENGLVFEAEIALSVATRTQAAVKSG